MASRLRNYKRVDNYVFNFSCPDVHPFCGDSKTHGRKARGYLYRRENGLRYHCHRCGKDSSFTYFLKTVAPDLYREYIMERTMGEGRDVKPPYDFKAFKTEAPVFRRHAPDLPQPFRDLPSDHEGRLYLESRKIPEERILEMGWTDDYFALARDYFNKYHDKTYVIPGIVIPVRDREKNIIGLQCRRMGETEGRSRYITTAFDAVNLVYGLERVDDTKDIPAFEGPFDSTFVDNAVACLGGNIINDVIATGINPKRFIICYDNEPRSKETVKKITRAIDADLRVFICPAGNEEKDINDLVLSTPELKVSDFIQQHTYHGMEAKIRLGEWQRC
jgi:hypothetical protein